MTRKGFDALCEQLLPKMEQIDTHYEEPIDPSDRLVAESLAGSQPKRKSVSGARLKVHAIVPYLIGSPWLENCVDTLLSQTYPLSRLSVVCDGDGCVADFQRMYPQVEFVRNGSQLGPFRGVEKAIRDSECDVILRADSDDYCFSWRLECLVGELIASGVAIVGSNCFYLKEATISSIGLFPIDARQSLLRKCGHAMLYPTTCFWHPTSQRYLRVYPINGD